MKNKSIKSKLLSNRKNYYIYLDIFNIDEKTLNPKQIKQVFDEARNDYFDRKISLGILTEISGHLWQELIEHPDKGQHEQLLSQLDSCLEIEYDLPNLIKNQEWEKIGQYLKDAFEDKGNNA